MRFKKADPVLWQDEQSEDFTGVITEVNKTGFRIDWDCPSPYGDEKNEVFYKWSYLDLVTPGSGRPVIRLDHSKIRNAKLEKIGI